MPDDRTVGMWEESIKEYGPPPTLPTTTAPPLVGRDEETYGYAYAPPGHLPGEPEVPMPEGPPGPETPANQRFTLPSGVVGYRETVGHHDRMRQLDQQAQAARMARDMAVQDARMADQMMRVARSTKDIEIAKRAIDAMGLQNDIQRGVPIHEAVARHPMALGSGFGAALQHTAPVPKPTVVQPSGTTPGYIQDPRGNPHFFPNAPASAAVPIARQAQPITAPGGETLGYDVGGGKTMAAKTATLSRQDQMKLAERYKERAKLTEEMGGIDWELKQKAGGFEKLIADKTAKAAKLDREIAELEGGAAPAAAPIGSTGKRAVKNPTTGKWEFK